MRGAITGKDVLFNSFAIIRLWGFGTWLSCLGATLTRRPSTFLGVLYPDGRRTRWTPNRSTFVLAPTPAQGQPPEAA